MTPTSMAACVRYRARAAAVLLAFIGACGGRSDLLEGALVDGGGSGSGGRSAGGAAGVANASQGASAPSGGKSVAGGGSPAGTGNDGAAGTPPELEPLWRQSYEPFCTDARLPAEVVYTPASGGPAADIWSEAAGVYVITGGDIMYNSGRGWQPFATSEDWGWLTGFTGGPLLKFGFDPTCSVHFVDAQSTKCSGAIPTARDVFVVDRSLAYAVSGGKVFRYDGSNWVLAHELTPAGAFATGVWASRELTAVSALHGRAYVIRNGVAEPQVGLTPASLTAVWGTAAGEVWIGSEDGELFHFVEGSWTRQASAAASCGAIRGIWGDSDAVYVHTGNSLTRFVAGSAASILELPCDSGTEILAIHGNSAQELFVLLRVVGGAAGCGEVQLRWFDGVKLRPL